MGCLIMASVGSKNKARVAASIKGKQQAQQNQKNTERQFYDEHVSPEIVQRYRDKFYKAHPNDYDEWSREALRWYADRIKKDIRIPQSKMLKQNVYTRRSGESKGLIGRMYFFEYEAKEAGDKKTGMYDRFPIVFFFNSYRNKEGKRVLLGLNLHYLHPRERALFLFQLLKFKVDKVYNARTKLKLQWQLIKGLGEKMAEECVHAYRIDRLQSKLIEIHPADWHIAAALQLQKWMKPNGDTPLASHARKMRRQAKKGK
ncbi:hypothetical protein [Ralstonia phage RSP15]|uniref:DNA end protector n=1 Tax=Ralstonia phage RSP15 TaxID=1785960 RepID=UPI00074D3E12|nr:DNA end protector [Ralstonia phage RSP15]BAU40043.1 hypothetical protein [Ralstonia phage RSP15]